MDAEDAGATLVTPARSWRSFPAGGRLARRPVMLPRNDFRDVPITSGRPSVTSSTRRRSSSRLCSTVLPNPIPGSSRILLLGRPRGDRERHPLLEERPDVADDVVVARVCCIVRGRRACASGSSRTRPRSRPPRPSRIGAERGHVVDQRRARATAAPRRPPPSRCRPRSRRRRLAVRTAPRSPAAPVAVPLGPTGSAPGRASTRRRRRASRRRRPRARARGRHGVRVEDSDPPSENESGVTFTTPMIGERRVTHRAPSTGQCLVE